MVSRKLVAAAALCSLLLAGCSSDGEVSESPTRDTVAADPDTVGDFAPVDPGRVVLDPQTGSLVVENELLVLVSIDDPPASGQIEEIVTEAGGSVVGSDPRIGLIQVEVSADDIDQVADSIRRSPVVEDVVRSWGTVVDVEAVEGDNNGDGYPDSDFGDDGPEGRWGLEMIDAPGAWTSTTGSSDVQIGVLDWGFYLDHEDLVDNVDRSAYSGGRLNGDLSGQLVAGYSDGNPVPQVHGTHVAGTICAKGNNGAGLAGVMWACSLHLSDAHGHLTDSTSADLIPDDEYIVLWRNYASLATDLAFGGAEVVNMSLGSFPGGCEGERNPLDLDVASANSARDIMARPVEAATLRSEQQGLRDVVWVAAAGNECVDSAMSAPSNLSLPAPGSDGYPNVVSVAAVNSDASLASFSNWNATLAAPGGAFLDGDETLDMSIHDEVLIWSTTHTCHEACSSTYGMRSGTSMAAPHVAGVAGLIIDSNSSLSASDVVQCLSEGAVRGGKQVEYASRYPRLRDGIYGTGGVPEHPAPQPFIDLWVLNAAESVQCARDPASYDPASSAGGPEQLCADIEEYLPSLRGAGAVADLLDGAVVDVKASDGVYGQAPDVAGGYYWKLSPGGIDIVEPTDYEAAKSAAQPGGPSVVLRHTASGVTCDPGV